MPEGRMLKKAITTSKTLPELKTDTARLIYTWLIPFLDINGRHIADPYVIKGTVVPRIKNITPEIVEECLIDMHKVGVIVLYEADGERYLEYTVFEKHQYLKSDREAKPTIPAPPKNKIKRTNSGHTPELHQSTPEFHDTSKVKESKVKESKSRSSADAAPVDNSKNTKDTKEKIKIISEAIYKAGWWDRVNAFVNMCKGKNQDAILHTLERFYKENGNGHKIEEPWAYCLKILKVENGNFNERTAIKKHEAIKEKEKQSLADFKIGDLCKGMS